MAGPNALGDERGGPRRLPLIMKVKGGSNLGGPLARVMLLLNIDKLDFLRMFGSVWDNRIALRAGGKKFIRFRAMVLELIVIRVIRD